MPEPNFNPIARPYRWLEYVTFGPFLERCRFYSVPSLGDRRRALVLGDGDGRFTARLLAANKSIEVEAVDTSEAMLRLLTRRVEALGRTATARLKTWQRNALDVEIEGAPYDVVATHFFLDCLTDAQLSALIERLCPHLAPGAVWVLSEFAVPARQPGAFAAHLLIGTLYRAFGLITGLKVRRLPDYASALRVSGFVAEIRKSYLGGVLVSEIWRWSR